MHGSIVNSTAIGPMSCIAWSDPTHAASVEVVADMDRLDGPTASLCWTWASVVSVPESISAAKSLIHLEMNSDFCAYQLMSGMALPPIGLFQLQDLSQIRLRIRICLCQSSM